MTWEILTAQIREDIYYSLLCHELFPKKRKRCIRKTRGTNEQININQHILKETKTRRKNVAMAWIDYKNVYDRVLQTLLIEDNWKCSKYPQNHKLYHECYGKLKGGINNGRWKSKEASFRETCSRQCCYGNYATQLHT